MNRPVGVHSAQRKAFCFLSLECIRCRSFWCKRFQSLPESSAFRSLISPVYGTSTSLPAFPHSRDFPPFFSSCRRLLLAAASFPSSLSPSCLLLLSFLSSLLYSHHPQWSLPRPLQLNRCTQRRLLFWRHFFVRIPPAFSVLTLELQC